MSNAFAGKRFRRIIGQKIKDLREINGMTQLELAKKLGFTSTGAISQVENGLRGLKVESIIKAAQCFKVHPVVFMTSYSLKSEEVGVISDLFKLFEKARTQPRQARPCIIAIRKMAHRMLRDFK